MINLYQLQSFVMVISEGSMTGAADKLFLTQPAISQQIRNLEEDLGVELLVRGVRQIKPTLQGEVLYEYARRILQLSSQAEVAVKAMGAEHSGHLRVGTLNSMGVQLMSPIVSRLLKYNPKLNIRIDYGRGDELVRNFNKGQLDVLILPEVVSQFGIEAENSDKNFLLKEEMWLVGTGKDMEIPKQISMSEYNKYPVILFSGELPKFNQLLDASLAAAHVKVEPTFESSNVGTIKRVIESGLGWGFLPSMSIKKQVKMGRLSQVHVKSFSYDVEYYYYMRRDQTSKPVADVFFQALLQQERG